MAELELSPIQQKLVELVLHTPAPGKHAARCAVRHIQKAWLLRDVDAEMAIFRALTGEEEAARAIFHALQRRRYPGAERLRWNKHEHKNAVIPFFQAIGASFADMQGLEAGLQIGREDGELADRLRIFTKAQLADGPYLVYPEPPLDYELSSDDRLHDFSEELAKLATEQGVTSVRTFVRERANRRNELLYASEQGIPTVTSDVGAFVTGRRDDVFRMISAYLLIDPYPQHQRFVVQCLDVFLNMLALIPPAKEPSEPPSSTA